ncbi:hypothetical protein [Sphingomonas sp.]|uniref:hypothetical protein n=1 Tax=Sphingomonas sp. TaxID=28214 RepID=UPI003B3AB297
MEAQGAEAEATAANETIQTQQQLGNEMYPQDGAPVAEGEEPRPTDAELAEQIEAEEAAKPAINAPHSWNDEDKAIFARLDPEAQAVVLRRETQRDRQVWDKSRETSQIEARARVDVLKIQNNYATQVQALLSGSQPPQRPDPRLLQTGQEEHRALFYSQEAEVRAWETQQQQLQSYLGQIQSHAQALEEQHVQAQRAEDEQLLATELGDTWSEPSKRQKFLTDLEPIGGELGYTKELMAQANATDILALRKAHSWKEKAEKWDKLQKAKMTDVRAGRSIPPRVTQPGVSGAQAGNQPKSVAETLYPNDVRR